MTDFFEHLIYEFKLPLGNPVLVFSLILFIILLSPILLKRLNIPGIIGLIISGVIIGPHGLNLLEKNSAIDLFSTIGLLYIMFIAGLDLDMNEFKANRNKSLLFGFFTFIFPLAIGYPVCRYFLGFDFNASLLTASMFATHTLVAYPIVSKIGISKNQAVAVAVGGTIITDTAVLIILAVIIGNSKGNLNADFWITLGVSLLIFSAIMFYLIPRISKWFFRKLESEKHSHYIYVLSVVFFSAFLAEVAGVEPIIGAFVAGLAMNKLIPHSSALMNRIEFIGNSLFIPFFLISVGMLVDIRVILNGTTAVFVAVTLTIVAIFGKWVAAFFTQVFLKYSRSQRQLIFGLSTAHAAATLAVILVGYKAGILDENILNGTIILILITCIVASFATEKASKKILLESAGDMSAYQNENAIRNEQILMPFGSVEGFEKTFELAVFMRDKKSVTPLSILSVVSNDKESEMNILKARTKLEDFVKQGSASETHVKILTTIDHNTASGIVRIAREIMADVVVLNWPRKTNIFEKLMGEKLETIVENTEKTIIVSKLESPLVSFKRMIVIAPPLCEKEYGFSIWLTKIGRLAQELSIPVVFHGIEETNEAMQAELKRKKINFKLQFNPFEDWEIFMDLVSVTQADDLFVLVSARKGSVSHFSMLDSLPAKVEKMAASKGKLLIYPQEFDRALVGEQYEDFNPETLNKGIEAVQKIGKGIGNIFKS